MVFSSTVFLFLFLPLTLILYHLPIVKSLSAKNRILLIASIVFYAWGEPVFVLILLFSVVLNWLDVRAMQRWPKHRTVLLILILVYDIGLLFVCKYLAFFAGALNDVAGCTVCHFTEIALPIGISFFTFQILSYVIDVYTGRAAVQKNVCDLALYVTMFPQLIAGPIVRYNTVAAEIRDRTVLIHDMAQGIQRFSIGLGKKVLLANYVAIVADNMFVMLKQDNLSSASAWLGILCYALQIYFDFSGYSDMAIGLGRMFGFHFEENFNYPYMSRSITDFWRRWHISLGTWFRDYVYIPMGGNRVSKRRWILNCFVVWLLTGLWHGANWTFVLWGLFYFVLLVFEKMTGLSKNTGFLYRIPTLLFVLLGWVLFRAESLSLAGAYYRALFSFDAADTVFFNQIQGGLPVIIAACIACTPLLKRVWSRLRIPEHVKTPLQYAAAIALCALSMIVCVSATYNPFIYFNF